MNSKQNEPKSAEDLLEALLGPGGMSKKGPSSGKTPASAMASAAADELDLAEEPSAADETEETPTEASAESSPEATAAPERARRKSRASQPATTKSSGLGFGQFFGAGLLCGGIAVTLLEPSGSLRATLSSVGLDAPVLLTIGAVAFVMSAVRRQHALAVARYEELASVQQETRDEVQSHLQKLVDQREAAADRPPAEGEELARVLDALERQDEKIGNITRALKMYGKPLMEIATQGNDLAAQIAQTKQQMDAFGESLQQGLSKLETAARGRTVDLGPLEAKLVEFAADTRRNLAALGERMPSESSLQQQLVRVEAQITALSQRMDDSEMRKSLLRLEDSNKLHGKKLEQLAHQDAVHEEVQRLEKLVDTTIGKLSHTVDQVRDKELGTLESTIRDIQREVTGLATSVAYIQQTVRGVAARPAAPAAPAERMPEPALAGARIETTAAETHTPTPTAAPSTPSAPFPAPSSGPVQAAPGATADAQAGVAENRTGARATSSKNVLGAIQKLKKMKG